MMASLTFLRNRDATVVIRGFVYQVDLTVARWLDLQPGQTLELERGEDIDTIANFMTTSGEVVQRKFEQIKFREKASLTLHSPEAITAIANFIEHRAANPDIELFFRYTTNAGIGRENNSLMPGKMEALVAWERIRQESLPEPLQGRAVQGLRATLRGARRPSDLPAATWSRFQSFVRDSSDAQFVTIIQSFEWGTNTPVISALRSELQQRLLEKRYAIDAAHAREQYRRLFYYVLDLLSARGAKQLTVEERTHQLSLPFLSESDQAKLDSVMDRVLDLELRVDGMEARIRAVEQQHSSLFAHIVTRRVHGLDAVEDVGYRITPPMFDVPSPVAMHSRREEMVRHLRSLVIDHSWTALHGRSAYSGKTQLAILLTRTFDTCCTWVQFSHTSTIEQACDRLDDACRAKTEGLPVKGWYAWYCHLCEHVGEGALIVLDDLPLLSGGDELSQRLRQLVKACSAKGVRILSTSPHVLPMSFASSFSDRDLITLECPPLKDSEAAEILQSYDASSSVLAQIPFINVLAQGNPLLVTAIAGYLRQQQWQFTGETLAGLFKQAYATGVSDEIVQRLLATIVDAQGRELLYRLALLRGAFSPDDVLALAAVDPKVERAGEHLTKFTGLWVQRDAEGRLHTSPLLRTLGEHYISLETRKACSLKLGEWILQQAERDGALPASTAFDALIYFTRAEQFNRAGVLLVQVLQHLHSIARSAQQDMGALALWSRESLPHQMDLSIRLYLRGLQISLRHARSMDTSYLVADLERLMHRASRLEVWAILGVVAVADNFLPDVHQYLLKALQFLQGAEEPEGDPLKLAGARHMGSLIWANILSIKTPKQLHDWMGAVDLLTPAQRRDAFSGPQAEWGCMTVASRLWHEEADKPKELQRWDNVLSLLGTLEDWARELDVELLWACAVRAQVMVLAEYGVDLAAATNCAQEALARASHDPRVRFLIKECVGRQYVYAQRYVEARLWLDQAINEPTDTYPSVRMYALLHASRAAGQKEPQTAVRYAQEAVEVTKTSEGISKIEQVKALGELTIAEWLAGDLKTAFDTWEQAAEHLLACRTETEGAINSELAEVLDELKVDHWSLGDLAVAIDVWNESLEHPSTSTMETNDWRDLFVVYGHVSGYLTALAYMGQPLATTPAGEPYVAPTRGIFLTYNASRASLYDKTRDCFLMAQLTRFAEAVGKDTQAEAWASRGVQLAREMGHQLIVAVLRGDMISYMLLNDQYVDVLDAALETETIAVALQEQHRSGGDVVSRNLDVQAILGPKPNEKWEAVEYRAILAGLIPLLFWLSTSALSEPEDAKFRARAVAARCREIGTTAAKPWIWTTVAGLLEQIYEQKLPAAQLLAASNAIAPKQYTALQLMGYVGATLQPDIAPEDAVQAHVAILNYVYQMFPPPSAAYRRIVLPFFTTYWGRSCKLQKASSAPEKERIHAILRDVAHRLHIEISLADPH